MKTITITFTIHAALVALPCVGHAITLQNLVALSFGTTDYSPPLTGSLNLGTNGTVAYGASYSGGGTGLAGQVEIQGTLSEIVDISCAEGKLASPGGIILDMPTTAVVGSSNVANWGSTPLCTGLGNIILTHTITGGAAANTIYVGAQLTPSTLTGATFTTGESGGEVIQIRAIVQ